MKAQRGFTFFEVLVALWLAAVVSVFLLQGFVAGMGHSGRANERAAATTVATQVIEQIRASVNPYTMVGFADIPRTPLPLPLPYRGITNPAPYTFQVAVDVTLNANLTMTMATVEVYRPSDLTPFVVLATLLDDQ